MVITVDAVSETAIYLQIRAQIIAAIAAGELEPGDGLPSVRSLASDLGVNLHTVNKAYAVLRDEGYLLMRGRAGALVADRSLETIQRRGEEQDARMSDDLYRLALAHRARGGTCDEFIAVARSQAAAAYDVVLESGQTDGPCESETMEGER